MQTRRKLKYKKFKKFNPSPEKTNHPKKIQTNLYPRFDKTEIEEEKISFVIFFVGVQQNDTHVLMKKI